MFGGNNRDIFLAPIRKEPPPGAASAPSHQARLFPRGLAAMFGGGNHPDNRHRDEVEHFDHDDEEDSGRGGNNNSGRNSAEDTEEQPVVDKASDNNHGVALQQPSPEDNGAAPGLTDYATLLRGDRHKSLWHYLREAYVQTKKERRRRQGRDVIASMEDALKAASNQVRSR